MLHEYGATPPEAEAMLAAHDFPTVQDGLAGLGLIAAVAD